MKSSMIFPMLFIALDVSYAIVYLVGGDFKCTIYWLAAAILTACVTY